MRVDNQPYLTREQERTASAETLILSHGRLVVKMAVRFARYGLDAEDLAQEGRIGLMHAARKFDPTKGFRFSTYAAWWVRERMMEAVFRGSSLVRPSTAVSVRARFFRDGRRQDLSLDAPLSEGGGTLGHTLICPAPLPDALAAAAIDGDLRVKALRRAICSLSERDATIITGRHLAEPKLTLDDLGVQLGLSKERVRQLETRALERLRAALIKELDHE